MYRSINGKLDSHFLKTIKIMNFYDIKKKISDFTHFQILFEVMSLIEKPVDVKTPNICGSRLVETPNCLQIL